MAPKGLARKRYPAERTAAPWAIVEPLLPPAQSGPHGGPPRQVAMREGLKTLFSLNQRGGQWDRLPPDWLPKSTLEHAIRVLEQGLALCRASSSRSLLPSTAAGLGSAYALQGRLAAGHALLEEAISEGIRIGSLRGYAHRVAAQRGLSSGGTRR
jgi:putative transposase of IS4/5 family DUF4096